MRDYITHDSVRNLHQSFFSSLKEQFTQKWKFCHHLLTWERATLPGHFAQLTPH